MVAVSVSTPLQRPALVTVSFGVPVGKRWWGADGIHLRWQVAQQEERVEEVREWDPWKVVVAVVVLERYLVPLT
jgi:hypothetical protein